MKKVEQDLEKYGVWRLTLSLWQDRVGKAIRFLKTVTFLKIFCLNITEKGALFLTFFCIFSDIQIMKVISCHMLTTKLRKMV